MILILTALLLLSPFITAQDVLPGMLTQCASPSQFALTFDDGPSEFTQQLLSMLDEHHVPATFFVLGTQVDQPQFQQVFRDTYARGHQIAVHTYDHPHLNALSPKQIKDQLSRTDQAIRNVIGVSPQYMRPPFGECLEQCQQIVQGMGYTIVEWNLDSNDWRYAQSPRLQSKVTTNFIQELDKVAGNTSSSHIPPTSTFISLQHDIQGFSVSQTPAIIRDIKRRGYSFVTVAECAGSERKPMYSNAPDSLFKPGNTQLPPMVTAANTGNISTPIHTLHSMATPRLLLSTPAFLVSLVMSIVMFS